MKKPFLSIASIFAAFASCLGQGTPLSTTTVDWFNNASTLLRDFNNTPLSQGTTSNNDGMLVELGYFSSGTTGSNFTGTWIPLTSFGASLNTAIGDSPNAPSSGLGDGRIGFTTIFHFGTDQVEVYDSLGDSGFYLTQSSIQITSNGATGQPVSGQVLAIRFYNTTTGTTGQYNTVSADNWLWSPPTEVGGGAAVLMNMGTSSLEWEDPSNPFETTILVPEPSTFALFGVGALAFAGILRRRTKV